MKQGKPQHCLFSGANEANMTERALKALFIPISMFHGRLLPKRFVKVGLGKNSSIAIGKISKLRPIFDFQYQSEYFGSM